LSGNVFETDSNDTPNEFTTDTTAYISNLSILYLYSIQFNQFSKLDQGKYFAGYSDSSADRNASLCCLVSLPNYAVYRPHSKCTIHRLWPHANNGTRLAKIRWHLSLLQTAGKRKSAPSAVESQKNR